MRIRTIDLPSGSKITIGPPGLLAQRRLRHIARQPESAALIALSDKEREELEGEQARLWEDYVIEWACAHTRDPVLWSGYDAPAGMVSINTLTIEDFEALSAAITELHKEERETEAPLSEAPS